MAVTKCMVDGLIPGSPCLHVKVSLGKTQSQAARIGQASSAHPICSTIGSYNPIYLIWILLLTFSLCIESGCNMHGKWKILNVKLWKKKKIYVFQITFLTHYLLLERVALWLRVQINANEMQRNLGLVRGNRDVVSSGTGKQTQDRGFKHLEERPWW